MKKLLIAALAVVICFTGCGKRVKNSAGNDGEGVKVVTETVQPIKRPSIPAMINDPVEKAAYYATHFWDTFDFADTTYIGKPEITEQALVDYLMALSIVPAETASSSIKGMLAKAEQGPAMFEYFTDLYDKYLYDPNSPARNEELYIPVLEYIVASGKIDDLDKLRPRSQLKMAMKNRVGEKASDFTFITDSGKKMRLYDVKADYTLLFINNPDCDACAQVIQEIRSSQMATALTVIGTMKVVALYPDEDLAAWRKHLPDMPDTWIRGYDAGQTIRNNSLYDLKAIPTLYLLDKDKKVLIKDAASFTLIDSYLRSVNY